MTNDKNKPIVTEEMLQQASYAFLDANPAFQTVGYKEMRAALEAALAVQPKPQLTQEELWSLEAARQQRFLPLYVLDIIDRLTGEKT